MFICIEKNPDGSRAFQSGGNLLDGWAFVPFNLKLPDSFPYVEIETTIVEHPAIIRKVTEIVDREPVEKEVIVRPAFKRLEVVSMAPGERIPVNIEKAPTADDVVNALLGVNKD